MDPIFTSHFSIGKSILTLDHPDKQKADGPDSVFALAIEGGLKKLILVEESMTGFFEAVKISNQLGIQLIFGYKFLCSNTDGDKNSIHKLIAFAKNDDGCKQLNKLYSLINSKYGGVISNQQLSDAWSDDLHMAIPFYDSFIFKNQLSLSSCIPSLQGSSQTFFVENNGLPFDSLVKAAVDEFIKSSAPKSKTMLVKSIYYKHKSDCPALQTYKILSNRKFGKQSSLSCPNLDHFGSDEFSWESYIEQTNND